MRAAPVAALVMGAQARPMTILRVRSSPRRPSIESAGLLMYRRTGGELEVLLVHLGGPLWARRDRGAWSIPKGEFQVGGEDPFEAARREFAEETGLVAGMHCESLGKTRLRSGKLVHAWAFEGDGDPSAIVSNSFDMEWPPHSGRLQRFAEVDRAAWLKVDDARNRIHPGQKVFLDRLRALLT